jgi:hypothetical protein
MSTNSLSLCSMNFKHELRNFVVIPSRISRTIFKLERDISRRSSEKSTNTIICLCSNIYAAKNNHIDADLSEDLFKIT